MPYTAKEKEIYKRRKSLVLAPTFKAKVPFQTKKVNDPVYRRESSADSVPSIKAIVTRDITPKVERQKYTGEKLIGISIVHKSGLQPVFSVDEATDLAHMRR